MHPFLPDTLLTIAWPVALLVVSALVLRLDRRLWPVLLVPWANWLATRAITWADGPAYAAGVLDLASAAALLLLWRLRTMAVLPLAALYGLMVFSYGLHDLGWIGRETMWAFVDVAGYAQLLLLAGLAGGGGRRFGLGFLGAAGAGRDRAVAGAVARRVQPERPS